MADRAAENGAPSSTVRHSSAQVPASGTLGSAMSSTSPPRTRSRVIMTWRRGNGSSQARQQRGGQYRRQVGQGVRERGEFG